MTISIRRGVSTDVETIFQIRTGVTQNHLSYEQLEQRGITVDSVAEALDAERCCWVAELDGQIAAFTMIDSETGSVFALFVDPLMEGRGLATLLMDEAEKALFGIHSSIWLTTDPAEQVRANGFYRRRGWLPVGINDDGEMRYEKVRPTDAITPAS
jgi:ribosomal protein S18 acetylase RimI-like enzyme